MGLYAFASLTGSPGATTTALTWATCSATPTLLVEADLTGGSAVLAGRLRGQIPHHKTILAVAGTELEDDQLAVLQAQTLPLPGAVSDSSVIPTIARHTQALGLDPAWPTILSALRQLSDSAGMDVLVDVGRLTTRATPWAVLDGMDAVLVTARAALPDLTCLTNNLSWVSDHLPRALLGVVLVEAAYEGWSTKEVSGILRPTPVLGTIPNLPKAAAAYSHGWQQAPKRQLRGLHAATTTLAHSVHTAATTHRETLLLEDPR